MTQIAREESRESPVLTLEFLQQSVIVASVELLFNKDIFLIRARSTDGVEAVTVPNPKRIAQTFPIFLKHIAPVVVKQDARRLESLLWDVYRHDSNYKLQGMALWPGVAAIEMALLELMAQTAQRPVADFFGGQLRRDIPVYYASYERGNRPEDEVAHLQELAAGSGVKAIKFRIGGRMNHNVDSLPGRTESLIPLARKTFGDDMTLCVDANSSYDVLNAIRIGKLLEEQRYAFFEEPCPFDDLWETKAVADALEIPVCGGEQEFSLRRWRWTIENRGVDIVQPDLHYGGGFLRTMQVARLAAEAGMQVMPHMAGGGLAYLDVLHLASLLPNLGSCVEFHGNRKMPIECATSSLECRDGVVRCPEGVGFGIVVDPYFVRRARAVKVVL